MSDRPIPTPVALRLARARDRILPPVLFLLLAASCFLLWIRYPSPHQYRGLVDALYVELVPVTHGQLVALPAGSPELFQAVEAGQLLARLDDAHIVAELRVLHARLEQVHAELNAARQAFLQQQKSSEWSQRFDQHRARIDWEQLQLDILRRRAELAVDRIELERETERYDLVKALVEKRAESEFNLLLIQFRRDALAQQIEEHERFIVEAERHAAVISQRVEALSLMPPADLESQLAPRRAQARVLETELSRLEVQRQQLELRAPISGLISQLHAQPGQNVIAGNPIVSLSESAGRSITVYVGQDAPHWPQMGDVAEIRVSNRPRQTFVSHIVEVGPRIDLVPEVLRRDPRYPEWGVPIRIALPDDFVAAVGQIVDVTLRPGIARN